MFKAQTTPGMFNHFNPSNQPTQSLNDFIKRVAYCIESLLCGFCPTCPRPQCARSQFEKACHLRPTRSCGPYDLLFLGKKTCFLSTKWTLTVVSWMLCKNCFLCVVCVCVFWFSGALLSTSMEIPLENGRAHRAARQSDLPISSNTSLSTAPVARLIFCIGLADEHACW